MKFLFIQFIGAIGYSLLAYSYFKEDKRQILFMQIFAYLMFVIHYYLLSGITGAICNLIGLFALLAIYILDKSKFKNIVATFFIVELLLINIYEFQNFFSIFPLVASISVIISFLNNDEDVIRIIGIISAICWLVYAVVYKSYIAIVFEVLTLIGTFYAYIKSKKI